MGRPPCCDKVGVKKGPWTPEEDIMLVSYVQEHGPGNWRAVPTVTGLKRCSKSCRLRWTNYLRPGIKRGSFTDQEEKMIIQLQALLGNKWAAIASYLPERTDNDIKNYWNTHLKKKLKKMQNGSGSGSGHQSSSEGLSSPHSHSISRGQWERRLQADIHTAKQALQDALTFEKTDLLTDPMAQPTGSSYSGQAKPDQEAPYVCTADNIARLLKQWVKNPAKVKSEESSKCSSSQDWSNSVPMKMEYSNSSEEVVHPSPSIDQSKSGVDLSEAFESLFGFDSFGSSEDFSGSTSPSIVCGNTKSVNPEGLVPLSLLENWLFDDQGNLSFDEPDLF